MNKTFALLSSVSILAFALFGCKSGADSPAGIGGNDNPDTSSSPSEIVRPQNVDAFNITAENKKTILSAVYSSVKKQYLITYQTYTEVNFTWNCSDSKVAGIVAMSRNEKPEDGFPYTGSYKEYSLNPSGTMVFPKWDKSTGYYQLYIWSYDKDFVYSNNYYLAEIYIEPAKSYQEWNTSPLGD